MTELAETEQRVHEKWRRAAIARGEDWKPLLDTRSWIGPDWEPPTDLPQFPREQWACYPDARFQTLILCEQILDSAEALSTENWLLVCMAMQFGGKTRLA